MPNIIQLGGTTTGTTADPASSLVIAMPTSANNIGPGDILTAGVTSDSTVPTAPSGWTEFGGGLHPSASWNVRLYYRVVTGTEGANFTWTVGTVGPSAGYINAWRGVDTSNPILGPQAATATTSTEPLTTPSLTVTPTANGRVFYVRAVRDSPGGGLAVAANITEASATASRRANIGALSSTANTSYTICQASDDADFVGTAARTGLALTCDIAEDHNYSFTYALRASLKVEQNIYGVSAVMSRAHLW